MPNLAVNTEDVDTLAAAFAAAEYVIRVDPAPIVIRIGECTPALDRLLDGRHWAVVTAHNPGGMRRSASRNDAAQRLLTRDLRELAPDVLLAACNRDPHGRWPDEPGWLFTPESAAQADALATRFGQRAIVVGQPGHPAELRWYGNGNASIRGNSSAVVS